MLSIVISTILSLAFVANGQSSSGSAPATDSLSATATVSALNTLSSASIVASSTSTANFPSLSGYSACATNCMAVSVGMANCTSLIDVNCFCPSRQFATLFVDCVDSSCGEELLVAEGLIQQFCAQASSSISVSFPPTSSATGTTSQTRSLSTIPSTTNSVAPTETAPPSSGAMARTNTATSVVGCMAGLVGLGMLL